MTDHDDQAGLGHHLAHPLAGLILEGHVADAEHPVHRQAFRLDGGADGESQPHHHARGIIANGHLQELPELAEFRDLLHLGTDAARRLALEITAKRDVFPAVGVPLEAEGDIEERTDPALDGARAARRRVDAGQHLEQRALAGAVMTENADAIAVAGAQANVAQSPHLDDGIGSAAKHLPNHEFLQGDAAHLPHPEGKAYMIEFDFGHASMFLLTTDSLRSNAPSSTRGSCPPSDKRTLTNGRRACAAAAPASRTRPGTAPESCCWRSN